MFESISGYKNVHEAMLAIIQKHDIATDVVFNLIVAHLKNPSASSRGEFSSSAFRREPDRDKDDNVANSADQRDDDVDDFLKAVDDIPDTSS